jgi:hypothetical protein
MLTQLLARCQDGIRLSEHMRRIDIVYADC